MPFLNYTSAFGNFSSVYTNVSSTIANQPPQMTTQTVWLFFVAASLILLIVSRLKIEETARDLCGVIASIFLLISAIQAFAVDTISGVSVVYQENTFIATVMETHTIYHYDLIGVVLGVIFVFSLANLYLLWLDSKKPMEQEQVRKNGPRYGDPNIRDDAEDAYHKE
jgi:hypothetical protein